MRQLRRIGILGIAAIGLLLGGCSSTPPNDTTLLRVQNLAYAASSLGTQATLISQPQYRPAFELAYTNLDALVNSKLITGDLLRQIIATLPNKQLSSPQAQIAIEGVTVLFDTLVGTRWSIEAEPVVLAAATGVRDGLKVALGH